MKMGFALSRRKRVRVVIATVVQSKLRMHVTELGKGEIPPVLTIIFVLSEGPVATRVAVH